MAADVLPSGAKFTATHLPMETVKQLLKRHSTASPKTKLLLENECEIILECRFCQSLFRRSVDFISHKENFCKSAQSAMANLATIKSVAEGAEESADLSQQVMHATPKSANKIVSIEANGTHVEERRPVVKFKNQIPADRQPAVIPTQQNVLYRRETRSGSKRALVPSFIEPEPKKKAVMTEKKPTSVLTVGSTRFLPARLQEKAKPKEELKKEEKQPTVSPSPVRLKRYDEDNYEFDPDHTPTENEEQMYGRVFKYVRNSVDLEALRCVEPECEDSSNFQSIESLAFHLLVRHTSKCLWFQHYACLLCNRKLRSLKSMLEHVANRHINVYMNHAKTSDPTVTFPSMEFREDEIEKFTLLPLSSVEVEVGEQEVETKKPGLEPQPEAEPEERPELKQQSEQVKEEDSDWSVLMKEQFENLAKTLKSELEEEDFLLDDYDLGTDDMPPLTKEEPMDEFSGEEEESPPVLSAEDDNVDSISIKEEEEVVEPNTEENKMSIDLFDISDELAEVQIKESEAMDQEQEEEQNADSNSTVDLPPPLSPHMSSSFAYGDTLTDEELLVGVSEDLEPSQDLEKAVCMESFVTEEEEQVLKKETSVKSEPMESPNEKSTTSSLDVTTESNSSVASTSSSGKRERRIPNRFREDAFQFSGTRPPKERSHRAETAAISDLPVLEREQHPHLEREVPPVIEKMVSPERERSLSSVENGRGARVRRPPCWIQDFVP